MKKLCTCGLVFGSVSGTVYAFEKVMKKTCGCFLAILFEKYLYMHFNGFAKLKEQIFISLVTLAGSCKLATLYRKSISHGYDYKHLHVYLHIKIVQKCGRAWSHPNMPQQKHDYLT